MRRFREYVAKNTIAVWFVSGAVIFGGLYYYNAHQVAEQEACQAKYNTNFTETSRIRSQLITARLDAQDSLLQGITTLILNPLPKDASPDLVAARQLESNELFRAYNRASRENEALRAANQLPETPSC